MKDDFRFVSVEAMTEWTECSVETFEEESSVLILSKSMNEMGKKIEKLRREEKSRDFRGHVFCCSTSLVRFGRNDELFNLSRQ